MSNDKKLQVIEQTIAGIERKYGIGSYKQLGDIPALDVEGIRSRSIGLDIALGIGGYPRGRVVEIYGPESSGKTTLALHAIAEVQRQGGTAAFIDAEHALDVNYAQALGVNIEDLLLAQSNYGEDALGIVDVMINYGIIVIYF